MNNDLISREALKKAITEATYNFEQIPIRVDKVQEIIDNAPTIENPYIEGHIDGMLQAEKLYARPQGEWIKWNFKTFGAMGDWEYRCSNCEKVYGGEYNFCPNCGADMKGGAE